MGMVGVKPLQNAPARSFFAARCTGRMHSSSPRRLEGADLTSGTTGVVPTFVQDGGECGEVGWRPAMRRAWAG